MHAPGAFADMAALREAWHPVAFARDLAGERDRMPARALGGQVREHSR